MPMYMSTCLICVRHADDMMSVSRHHPSLRPTHQDHCLFMCDQMLRELSQTAPNKHVGAFGVIQFVSNKPSFSSGGERTGFEKPVFSSERERCLMARRGIRKVRAGCDACASRSVALPCSPLWLAVYGCSACLPMPSAPGLSSHLVGWRQPWDFPCFARRP